MMKSFFPRVAFLLILALAGCNNSDAVEKGDEKAPAEGDGAAAATSSELSEKGVIAVVNGKEIPAAFITVYAQAQPSNDVERAALISNIIASELIAQQARADGLAARDDVAAQLVISEQTILGRAYVEQFFAGVEITQDDVQARYDELSDALSDQKEYSVAHILVEGEDEANVILQEIKADAEKFAELAKEYSQDPGSGQAGGELGWVAPEALVPAFSGAMTALAPGEMTDAPVQSRFGWHIIRLNETRPRAMPPLNDDIGRQLTQSIRASMFAEHIKKLEGAADIQRAE